MFALFTALDILRQIFPKELAVILMFETDTGLLTLNVHSLIILVLSHFIMKRKMLTLYLRFIFNITS